MRAKIFLLALQATLAYAAAAQSVPHCYLEVNTVESSHDIEHIWESGWGSYERGVTQRTVLKMRVGTTSRASGTAIVGWYFLGRAMNNYRTVIYGSGEKRLTIPAAYFTESYTAAPDLKSHDLTLVTLGQRFVSGALHDGWIVYVRNDNGEIMASKASRSELLDLFNRRDEFSKLPRPAETPQDGPKTTPRAQKVPGIRLSKKPIARPPPSSPSPAGPTTVTIKEPTRVTVAFGEVLLQPGTKLQVIARTGAILTAQFGNERIQVPVSATDLQ